MSRSSSTIENQVRRNELIDGIRKEDGLVVVVGTGVSMASLDRNIEVSVVAGWQGLLRNGLDRCKTLGLIENKAACVVKAEINEGSVEFLISAAQKITDRLKMEGSGMRFWLRESIGQLELSDSRTIDAIVGLGGILATLNYDDLLHHVTKREPLHWLDSPRINSLLRDKSREFILHLHGHWRNPDSVILDRKSYEKITEDVKTHDLLREFTRMRTLLFVGCGDTFLDPNLQTWLKWAKVGMAGEEHRHFILCREEDRQNYHKQLLDHGYLAPLVYGNVYADLEPFLLDLAREAGVAATAMNPPVTAAITENIVRPPKATRPSELWNLESKK